MGLWGWHKCRIGGLPWCSSGLLSGSQRSRCGFLCRSKPKDFGTPVLVAPGEADVQHAQICVCRSEFQRRFLHMDPRPLQGHLAPFFPGRELIGTCIHVMTFLLTHFHFTSL